MEARPARAPSTWSATRSRLMHLGVGHRPAPIAAVLGACLGQAVPIVGVAVDLAAARVAGAAGRAAPGADRRIGSRGTVGGGAQAERRRRDAGRGGATAGASGGRRARRVRGGRGLGDAQRCGDRDHSGKKASRSLCPWECRSLISPCSSPDRRKSCNRHCRSRPSSSPARRRPSPLLRRCRRCSNRR